MRARRIASGVALGLATLCVAVALLAGYARIALLDADQFADRATAALDDDAVRTVVATHITDDVVLRANRDLVAVRPLIEGAAGSIIGSSAFESLFRTAARDLHRTVFTDDQSTATLTVLDVGVLLSGALQRLDARAARQLDDLDVRLDAGRTALDAADAARIAGRLTEAAIGFAIGAALLLVAGILLAPDRRRGILFAGVAGAGAGAAVAIAVAIARARITGTFELPAEQAAARGVWDAFLSDLRLWSLGLAACGAIVAAAAASLLRPVDVGAVLARAARVVTTVPQRPALRLLRALLLVGAGVLAIVEPARVLEALVVIGGVLLAAAGVAEILRLVAPAAGAAPAPRAPRRRTAARRRPVAIGVVASALAALAVAGLFAGGATQAPAEATTRACNGHAALCDRPLDEVVFAGTHNAMSSASSPGWLFAQQEDDIAAQLDAGVRALLVDAYEGERVGSRVRTVLEGSPKAAGLVREIGPEAAEAALRIRDRLVGGEATEERDLWMCHGLCEVGATRLTTGLEQVRDFLVANPDDVVLIVIQDEDVAPEAVAGAIDASGLLPYVYTGPPGPPWPTLGEMVESGGRVVVMAENDAGGAELPWYHPAFELMQETPYRFTAPQQFSCEPNRGPSDASLFLLNHWIDTSPAPRPSNAAKVNASAVLLDRARTCQRERGLLPNVVAVDFYETGDLVEVVDTLNGLHPGS